MSILILNTCTVALGLLDWCFVGVFEESPEGENQCVSLYLLKAFYFRIVLRV